jgi:hypothetical protein
MMTPKVDLIIATASSKRDRSRETYNLPRFQNAMVILEAAMKAGKIWNQEFIDAKYYISAACEHAQDVTADAAREKRPEGGSKFYGSGDVRNDIGYAFGMNQSAKLSRNLKKLKGSDFTKEIAAYCDVLDEIAALFMWLKEFKAIIVKGRRPVEKTPEQIADEIANVGTCCICGKGQKLDAAQGMVHHGYEMSEYNHAGYRIGSCFGVKHLPYEFSCEPNKIWIVNVLKPQLKGQQAHLANLKASVPESLTRTTQKYEGGKLVDVKTSYDRGTTDYEQLREAAIDHTKFQISTLKQHIEHHTALVANWKLKPLADGTKLLTSTATV